MRRVFIFLFGVIIFSACASTRDVNVQVAENAEFRSYKTFMVKLDPDKEYADFADQKIEEVLEEEMKLRRLEKDTINPDLWLFYDTRVKQKTKLERSSYPYGYYYPWDWGYNRYPYREYTYQEGTVIIDIVDVRNKRLIWQGWLSESVDEKRDLEDVEMDIRSIMSLFPLKASKTATESK
jgi:hypothetical protein